MRFLSSTNGTEPPLRTRISLLLTSYVFLPKKLQFTQNFTRQGDAPSAFAALFHIPHSAPFPFKVLQLIFYKTQEVTLSPGCAHLKRLKTKYGISLCCFLSHCRSRSCLVFCFFCHVVMNSEDQRSTHWNYRCLSFNRSWRQRASLKDCWARKNLIEGRHWSPRRFVFSWVNSPTVISPFVPPAKSMVSKSSQRRNHNTLSSLQQVWVFL